VFLDSYVFHKQTVSVLGEEKQRPSWLFAIIAILPLLFWASTRVLHGHGDTASYHDMFVSLPDQLSELSEFMDKNITKDHGFYILSIIIRCLITNDYQVYFFIIATIQGLCLVSVYKKYSENFVFSLALFIVSTDYLSWMHNGIRQFTAVTIIFAATTLMLKKKYVAVIPIIIFASFFHKSALIMIPLVFILQGKAWNKKTIVFIFLTVIAILFVGEFTGFIDSSMQETQYRNVVSDYSTAGDDGTNPLRVLVYSVPTIIAFIGRKQIIESDNVLINYCTNASLLSTGLYVVSIFTSGIFFGRLPIYLSLFNYILIPWEINHIIPEHLKKPVIMLMFVFYILFYYYQVSYMWGLF
jgi:transmembrane protein EpsG